MTPTPYAFRIMGGADNARQLVDYGRVFHASRLKVSFCALMTSF